MQNKINVLYIDDEVNHLTSFIATFREDYKIFIATNATQGLEILRNNKIHVIITDQRMPKMTGVDFLVEVSKEFPDPIKLLLTGYSDIEAVIDAVNKGKIYYYLTKPWNEEDIRKVIKNAFEVFEAREKLVYYNEQLSELNEQLMFFTRLRLLS